jgi:hypothetical protein
MRGETGINPGVIIKRSDSRVGDDMKSIAEGVTPQFYFQIERAGRDARKGLIPAGIVILSTKQSVPRNAAWLRSQTAIICRHKGTCRKTL